MKYEVIFKGSTTVEADSLREANARFQRSHSEFEALTFFPLDDSGNEHEVIGHCEASGLSIFEDDKFVSDTDGVMILKEFIQD